MSSYPQEQNRVLCELGPRLRFTNDQRIRLARKPADSVDARWEMRSIVTPDTLPTWHRTLTLGSMTATRPPFETPSVCAQWRDHLFDIGRSFLQRRVQARVVLDPD